MGKRDSQRSKVYRAQERAFKALEGSHRWINGSGGDPDDPKVWAIIARRILRSRWIQGREWYRWTGRTIGVEVVLNRRLKGAAYAFPFARRIEFALGVMTTWILLHELAHVLAPNAEQHGRRFARIYLDLVIRWMGKEWGARLREEFRAGGVKYCEPRRWSPAAREAAACRMRKIRG